jgi:hypothetical protein
MLQKDGERELALQIAAKPNIVFGQSAELTKDQVQ